MKSSSEGIGFSDIDEAEHNLHQIINSGANHHKM